MKRKITFAFALLISTVLTQNVSALTLNTMNERTIYSTQQKKLSGNVDADFIESTVQSSMPMGGGIYNGMMKKIGNITGDFRNNSVIGYSSAYGGAIYNANIANIGNITGNFTGNYSKSTSDTSIAYGGAIDNSGSIGNIIGDFKNNYTTGVSVYGGAINNTSQMGHLTGSFIGNYAVGSTISGGGAIYNKGTINNITGDFKDNYAKTSSASNISVGGAIRTNTDMTFSSSAGAHTFSGNYSSDTKRGKNYNSIFVNNSSSTSKLLVTFDTSGGGSWTINDNIEGGFHRDNYVDYANKYDLSFIGNDTVDAELGTTTQFVAINNSIINVANVTVDSTTLRFGSYNHNDTTANNGEGEGKFISSLNTNGIENLTAPSVTSLMLNNAVFDVANGYKDEIWLKGYSVTNSFYHIDVNTDDLEADVLHIDGNVDPNNTTNVIVHASSDADIRGQSILFVHSTNDTTGTKDSFKVARVYGSPYLYDVLFNVEESSDGTATVAATNENKWFLSMNNKQNPNANSSGNEGNSGSTSNPDLPVLVAPEVIGSISLPSVATTQKVGMISNIMRRLGVSHLYVPGCSFCSYNWDGKPNHNLWVDTDYASLNIKSPVDIESNVWGIEAGADLQCDINNKLGVFVSYRKGNYEMNGDGKDYFSIKSSEIDTNSYLGGLYYQYDKKNVYAFATIFGGMQKSEVKTSDSINTEVDGVELGASLELGYRKALSKNLYLTPIASATYDQISYDDTTDNVGKTYEYEDIKQLEFELGVKLGYAKYTQNGYYNVYVKPSIVQTINDGDEVEITDLGTVDTLEDMTLGRVELGSTVGFNDNWSAYGWANHTFGSDYNATSVGFGLNYNW